jgi:hypothetical protein
MLAAAPSGNGCPECKCGKGGWRPVSFKGHILCHTCKVKLCLGKLLWAEDGTHLGFAHAGLPADRLGDIALAFMAQHIQHQLSVCGDDVVDNLESIPEFDMLQTINPTSPAAAMYERVQLAGVVFWRIPCEPPADRAERKRNRGILPT